ncbi:3-carboxy-cis,cis-muconate cycloisomerase [Microbacterium trichothecenolyticum]|uniref:lyase family protein n=1 Tax=Microbacterium trichothecenolyticum TaxID=69370 RepID=UPI0028624B18|nr:lyase family protein [Microbacterium trichothecenolyticum]MDR7110221.1 3-carboxy-cis,cis-muconate cycloisomerase [Microbacterium trichothecenolyticum]
MPSDRDRPALDEGLLSPVTVGHDETVTDAAYLDALVTAEVALARAYREIGLAPDEAVDEIETEFGWQGALRGCRDRGVDGTALAAAAVAGGNPVIPLVGRLKERVGVDARLWVHRGATSQDIVDTAAMVVARAATSRIVAALVHTEVSLRSLARSRRDEVAAARTLTQHAVPTTVGLRAAGWLRGVERARARVDDMQHQLPVQLGGAAGTLASFTEIAGPEAAAALPAAFAHELGLAAPDAPWHTSRWPITELGDALVQAIDAVGKIATDVATLSRTEIGELAEGAGGGSSAMPQKRNPAASVLIRSAALRAPQLGATLHLASALAADERPDGAWHAEWPTLRELLRLALGATAHAASLVAGLHVDTDAVARNLAATGGLIVSERLSIVLGPVLGAARVAELVTEAAAGGDLAGLLAASPDVAALAAAAGATPEAFAADLLDPARYTGLAGRLVDEAAARTAEEDA